MTGMDCILCKVLWILHLSQKTEGKNPILLAVIYEITVWEIHFWGYVCDCVSVYERKRWGNYSTTLGRQAIGLLDSQGSSRVRTHLSAP